MKFNLKTRLANLKNFFLTISNIFSENIYTNCSITSWKKSWIEKMEAIEICKYIIKTLSMQSKNLLEYKKRISIIIVRLYIMVTNII